MNDKPLLLSLFPGADLLGRGFELEGFCVVRGPDGLWGQDIRSFSPARHKFEGVIGGSPCQGFSGARVGGKVGDAEWLYSLAMLTEFARCVMEAEPEWFLLENVPRVPDIHVPGYTVQRFNLSAKECGCKQARLRCFQFGSKDGLKLVIHRSTPEPGLSPAALASEGKRTTRRTFGEFCQLQGLPADFDLPGLSREAKYQAVGNGVPVPMARVLATAIKLRSVTRWQQQLCICLCGRAVKPGTTLATPACRKRMQRRRDAAGVTEPGPVTTAASLQLL